MARRWAVAALALSGELVHVVHPVVGLPAEGAVEEEQRRAVAPERGGAGGSGGGGGDGVWVIGVERKEG